MAAPSSNGPFVVTQNIPAAATRPRHQGPPTSQPALVLQKFMKEKSEALGVVQIMIGLFSIFLGVIHVSAGKTEVLVASGVAFWGALFYFISGGLSIWAEKKGSRCLVIGSLVMNIFSSIAAGLGIMLCSVDLTVHDDFGASPETCKDSCLKYKNDFYAYQDGIVVVILLLSMIEMCISIAVSSLGCRSVCTSSFSQSRLNQPHFVVQNVSAQDPRGFPAQVMGVPMAQGVTIGHGMPMVPSTQGVTPASTIVPPSSY